MILKKLARSQQGVLEVTCTEMTSWPMRVERAQAYHIWVSQLNYKVSKFTIYDSANQIAACPSCGTRAQAVGHLPWVNIGSKFFCLIWNVLEA